MQLDTHDFSGLSAQDVLDGFPQKYEDRVDLFHGELVFLHTITYIMDRIIEFPFYLFAPTGSTFFNMVLTSFMHTAILIINRLAIDKNTNSDTLTRFGKEVFERVRPEYRGDFRECLTRAGCELQEVKPGSWEVSFASETQKVLGKLMKIRHTRIAHLDKRKLGDMRFWEENRPTVQEIKAVRDILTRLLQALSFNAYRPMCYWDYLQTPENQRDIDELLDCLARRNHLLNMPEDNPEKWSRWRARLGPREINDLNHYRRKFGLPEV